MSISRILMLAALLASTGNAVAASSVDLAVKGSITPSACTPTLANGGAADFGKISVKDLRPDLHTYLPHQYLALDVACDAATLFAIAATDNRPGTESLDDYYNFGIGTINGSEKLGYLAIWMTKRMVDDEYVSLIGSQDGGATWFNEVSLMDNGLSAIAAPNTLVPMPAKRLTAELDILAAIAPAKNLTFNKEESIDGSVTLTVTYL